MWSTLLIFMCSMLFLRCARMFLSLALWFLCCENLMFDLRQHTSAIALTSVFWVALFVAYALFVQRQPQPEPIEIIPPPTRICPEVALAPTPGPTATPEPLRIYVSGAVQNPGVYRLAPGSLVADAIDAAGGEDAEADLVAINLAHALADGEQIYVPKQVETTPPAPITRSGAEIITDAPGSGSADALIDLNLASAEELEEIPGVGPATAKRIIEARPFGSIDDLLRVKGIGEAKLAKMRPFVMVK